MRVPLLLLAALILAAGCRLPDLSRAQAPLVWTSESLILDWDPAADSLPGMLQTASYRVYYRTHSSGPWVLLGEVPAGGGPQILIHHAQLGDGSFDFAVTAVNPVGQASPLGSSQDLDASPFGGWYLIWRYRG